MGAITYADGTERDWSGAKEGDVRVWLSPASFNSADTVTVPTVTGKTVRIISCRDLETGDMVTATVSDYTITIDAAGGGSSTRYVLTWMYV